MTPSRLVSHAFSAVVVEDAIGNDLSNDQADREQRRAGSNDQRRVWIAGATAMPPQADPAGRKGEQNQPVHLVEELLLLAIQRSERCEIDRRTLGHEAVER